MLPLLALLLPSALAQASLAGDPAPLVVVTPLSALQPAASPPPEPPVALTRDALLVRLDPGEETAVDLILDLDCLVAGPVALPVIGADLALSGATLDGRPVALPGDPGGWRSLVAELTAGRHRLRVRGTVDTPRPELSLPLIRAARSRVELGGTWDAELNDAVPVGDGTFDLLGGERLVAHWQAPTPPAPRPQVVRAQVATALRVDAAGVEARAQVKVVVRHQPAATLQLRLPSVDGLDVQGAAVAGFSQQGDLLTVRLDRPLLGHVDLTLSYRAPAPSSEGSAAPLPVPVTTSGQLDASWVSVLAGDQGTVVPQPGRGLKVVPSARVPAWGKGLVPGATVTSLSLTGPRPKLTLRVLDLTPAEAPGTFVDEARYEVAHAAHGRALLRCRYQVRNDRGQYLALSLPPGALPLGVRVAGTAVQPVRDGDRLFIPLEKSVETLSGLVTFPVELSLLVPEAPWARRGTRTLTAPAVDAPVARARWEIVLPPGIRGRRIEGTPTVVDAWVDGSRSLTIGRATAVGAGSLAEEDAQAELLERSQDAWNEAYRAYQDNQFDVAREKLNESLSWDEDNAAAQALLGNVDVLQRSDAQEDGQSRRIRSMARAKTQGLEGEQSKRKKKAEASLRAGDYETAYKELAELESLTEQLAVVEDVDNVDQKAMLEDTRRQLSEVEIEVAARRGVGKAGKKMPAPVLATRGEPDTTVSPDTGAAESSYDLDDDEIFGELLVPEGSFAVIVDRDTATDKDVGVMIDGLDAGGGYGGAVGGPVGGSACGASGEPLHGGAQDEEVYFDAPDFPPEESGESLREERPLRPEVPTSSITAAAPVASTAQDSPAPPPPAKQDVVPVRRSRARASAALDDLEELDDSGLIEPTAAPAPSAASDAGHARTGLRVSGPSLPSLASPHPLRPHTVAPSHPLKPPPPPPDPRTVPTAASMDPAVTAAPLSVRPPRAGQRLLLDQRLLAPDDALTISLTWRSTEP